MPVEVRKGCFQTDVSEGEIIRGGSTSAFAVGHQDLKNARWGPWKSYAWFLYRPTVCMRNCWPVGPKGNRMLSFDPRGVTPGWANRPLAGGGSRILGNKMGMVIQGQRLVFPWLGAMSTFVHLYFTGTGPGCKTGFWPPPESERRGLEGHRKLVSPCEAASGFRPAKPQAVFSFPLSPVFSPRAVWGGGGKWCHGVGAGYGQNKYVRTYLLTRQHQEDGMKSAIKISGVERHAAIIKAARGVFVEKGFYRTTTRELAKAAGDFRGALDTMLAREKPFSRCSACFCSRLRNKQSGVAAPANLKSCQPETS
jgi:hypothetical protein